MYVPDIPLAATPVAVMSVVDPFRVTEHFGEFATLPSGILMANLNVGIPTPDQALTELKELLGKCWWTAGGSNSRPPRCERGALPAELAAHCVGVRTWPLGLKSERKHEHRV